MSGPLQPDPRLVGWIADRGWGSVVPALRRLAALDPAAVRALAGQLAQVDLPAGRAVPPLQAATRDVARCWSATAPPRHLARVTAAVAALAQHVAATRRRWEHAADELASAVTAVAAAIDRAHTAADWSPGYVNADTPRGRARTAAAADLAAAVAAADRGVTDVLASLVAADPAADPAAELRQLSAAGAAPGSAGPLPTGAAGWLPLVAPSSATPADGAARRSVMADLRSTDPHRRRFALGVQEALDAAARAAPGRSVQLLVYEPDALGGQGRAAFALGDVGTADHVAVLTPGIGNAPTAMAGSVPAAHDLVVAAERADPSGSTAVVLWFGYDIPASAGVDPADTGGPLARAADLLAAADTRAAEQGADLLTADLARLRPMLRPSADLTLVGHSMGAVVTARTLRRAVGADAVVLLGSPGTGIPDARASALPGVRPENLFVISHPQDPVTWDAVDLGAAVVAGLASGPTLPGSGHGFGTDPAAASFGAQVLDVPDPLGPGVVPLLGGTARLPDLAHHQLGNYLAGASLVAVGAVVAGRTSRPTRRPGR